jgi:hypothetical protein
MPSCPTENHPCLVNFLRSDPDARGVLTAKSTDSERQDVAQRAREFLMQLRDRQGSDTAVSADDLLLFLYRLRDGYRIVRSEGGRFKGPTFGFIHELLYQLESRPDETLASAEWREFVESLLNELASGKIALKKNTEH